MNTKTSIAVIGIGTGLFCAAVDAMICPSVPNNC
jgi:hypothetical protein